MIESIEGLDGFLNLKEINFTNNKISQIGNSLEKIAALEILHISGNQIRSLKVSNCSITHAIYYWIYPVKYEVSVQTELMQHWSDQHKYRSLLAGILIVVRDIARGAKERWLSPLFVT